MKIIWNIVTKDKELIHFFCQLGEGEKSAEIYENAEKFLCWKYTNGKTTSVKDL